ncbi:hypothetical protein [Candidatus Bealeia paramacronuclearis]|uniref:hypothetical protein n=1 Tax=Candidatus Bealeia paramacronuclearis TaxID=1921001 RepID=UPI0030CB1DDB
MIKDPHNHKKMQVHLMGVKWRYCDGVCKGFFGPEFSQVLFQALNKVNRVGFMENGKVCLDYAHWVRQPLWSLYTCHNENSRSKMFHKDSLKMHLHVLNRLASSYYETRAFKPDVNQIQDLAHYFFDIYPEEKKKSHLSHYDAMIKIYESDGNRPQLKKILIEAYDNFKDGDAYQLEMLANLFFNVGESVQGRELLDWAIAKAQQHFIRFEIYQNLVKRVLEAGDDSQFERLETYLQNVLVAFHQYQKVILFDCRNGSFQGSLRIEKREIFDLRANLYIAQGKFQEALKELNNTEGCDKFPPNLNLIQRQVHKGAKFPPELLEIFQKRFSNYMNDVYERWGDIEKSIPKRSQVFEEFFIKYRDAVRLLLEKNPEGQKKLETFKALFTSLSKGEE